jgi:zinc/manganese transport system substrate-binding protein
MVRRGLAVALIASMTIVSVSACATSRPASSAGRRAPVEIVAAENFWGSIAAQIGGVDVDVVSIIDNPSADPHDYEPTAADARAVDGADVVIGNGIGYDPWFGKLVDSDPDKPISIDVGDVVGKHAGDNPHQWYSPTSVNAVIDRITAALTEAAPDRSADFAAGRQQFVSGGLALYRQLIDTIKQDYSGVPVGASESIFAPLAVDLGLDLVTPAGMLSAVSEGSDPTVAEKATADRQIAQHQIKVWVYNDQNATPDVTRLTEAARRQGIPVVTITETLTPAGASFQDWQAAQLVRLQAALAAATR